jgi:SRSO17 transposase
MGQVGVCLGYYKKGNWVLVDGELYMPEAWFDDAHEDLRRRYHVPEELKFRTKPEIGLELIRRAKANRLPFQRVLADALYGKKRQFRADLDAEDMLYIADIVEDMVVYLEEPTVGVPKAKGPMGRRPTRPKVLSDTVTVRVGSLAKDPKTKFQTVKIREAERGTLFVEAYARQVWTLTDAMEVRKEWLLISKTQNGDISYSLSNCPDETPLENLVRDRADRYFVERIYEDQKSENGWDEFQALKYRAWQHNTALVALALWFITTNKLEFERDFPRDPRLKKEFELEVLPALSVANVREMLKAALPLPQISMDESCDLVAKHLVNRSRSMQSRKKNQTRMRGP